MSQIPVVPPGLHYPQTDSERTTAVVHYYRAEMARMTSWRDRIDRTSNWAITVVAALLSVSLSTPDSHHGVLLFGVLLVTLLWVVEARRYRFFDVYRSRIRRLERQYYAQVFGPREEPDVTWSNWLADDLRAPRFLITLYSALSRRLRRNYIWMYLILLLAWVLKITSIKLQELSPTDSRLQPLYRIIDNAALGPVPGGAVALLVVVFYAVLVVIALRRSKRSGEFLHGDVHV